MLSLASCSIGASNLRGLSFHTVRNSELHSWNGRRTSVAWNAPKCATLRLSRRSHQISPVCCSPSRSIAPADAGAVDGPEETKSAPATNQLIPNASEVESLVADICDTTSIAEFELKLNGFRLYVLRDVNEEHTPPTPPSPSPSTTVYAEAKVDVPNSNGSVSVPSLSISKFNFYTKGGPTLLDKAADEGLVILKSPRVGFFQTGRTIKGRRTPPACKEKDIVKEGQVLCYVEQLGGEMPIEADVSGEIVKIHRKDGDPVGYGDALISILPSFPGIKKLQ